MTDKTTIAPVRWIEGYDGDPAEARALRIIQGAGVTCSWAVVGDVAELTLSASGGGTGDVVGPSSSVASEIALFDGTTGKLIKRATTTGILKGTSGVLSAATAGTDYYAPGGTDVAVADGGTGASTAGGARTSLGLVIGSDVQAYDATLAAWAAAGAQGLPYFSATDTVSTLTLAADKGVYATGVGALATYDLTSFARTLLDDTTATTARTTLGVETDAQFVGSNFFPLAMTTGAQASSTSTITTNKYYRWPWVAPRTGTIDLFCVEVTASSGLSKAVVALWSDSAGALGSVLGESGELSFASPNGNKTGAPAANISVTQGTLYWVTMIGVSGASIRSFAAGDWRGPMGYPLAGGGYPSSRYEVTQTYANPTPAWPGGEVAANASSFRPCAFFRWAT